MAVAARTTSRVAERLMDVFFERFPSVLDDLVEMRVVAEPQLSLEVGVTPGSVHDLPAALPGHPECRIRVFASDAHTVLL